MTGKLARAAEMRAEGYSFEEISSTLGIHIQSARKAAFGSAPLAHLEDKPTRVAGGPIPETVSTIVRHYWNDNQWLPVSLPRLASIHGAFA